MPTLTCQGDAHINEVAAGNNYSTDWIIICDGSVEIRGMAQFDLDATTLASAQLTLYVTQSSTRTYTIYATDATVDTSTVTWNSAPAAMTAASPSNEVGQFVPSAANTIVEVDLDVDVLNTMLDGTVTLFWTCDEATGECRVASQNHGTSSVRPFVDTVSGGGGERPVADPGVSQYVSAGASVTLDGTSSYDPDGTIEAYDWELLDTSGPGVTLTGDTTATPSFTAPSVADGAELVFGLSVQDDDGNWSDQATVSVTVGAPVSGSVWIGDSEITKAWVGDQPVTKIWLGDTLVWEDAEEPQPSGDLVARINVGGPAVSASDLSWQADTYYKGIPSRTTTRSNPSTVFSTFRLDPVAYQIPLDDGCYTVRLLFAEPSASATAGDRIVHYYANGVAGSVDVTDEAGNTGTVTRTLQAVPVDDGLLDVRFYSDPSSDLAPALCGIEVSAGGGCPAPLTALSGDIRAQAQAAAAAGGTTKFQRGIYEVSASITLTDPNDAVLDFQGSTLLFTNYVSAFIVQGDGDVTIRNVTIDYDPLSYTQGTVGNRGSNWVDVNLDAGYPPPDAFTRTSTQIYPHYTPAGVWKGFFRAHCTKISNTVARMGGIPSGNMGSLGTGTRVAVTNRHPMYPGLLTQNGEGDVVYDRVTVHAAHGLATLAQKRKGGSVEYRFCTVEPGPVPDGGTAARLLTSNVDAIRGKVSSAVGRVLGCHVTRQGDDGINFHSHPGRIRNIVSGTQFDAGMVQAFNDPEQVFQSGQTVRIMNKNGGEVLATRTITAISDLGNGRKRFTVTPSVSTQTDRIVDVVENHMPGSIIRGSWFYDHYAFGMRLRGNDTKVQGCRWDATPDYGLLVRPDLWDDSRAWKESGWVDNLAYEYNYLVGRGRGKGVIVEESNSSVSGHTNLVFRGNRIVNWSGGIQLANCDTVLLDGNEYANNGTNVIIKSSAKNVTQT